ncbi:hypothetical protein K525DRAFT_201242, partial [Schizophyllum commune Loenen D]
VQKSVVNPFLVASNPLLLKFVSPEYDIPRYTPSSDTPHSKFITDLRLPDLGGNPDLLLDRLGEDPELRALISYIVQIRMNTRSKWIINTCGSGKTRLSLEALHQHFGIYLTAEQDGLGLGSADLYVLVELLLADLQSNVLDLPQEQQDAAFTDNSSKVGARFTALLLSRAYVMRDFLKLAARLSHSGKLEQGHKRAWLMLQLFPVFDVPLPDDASDEQSGILQSDIFATLMRRIIDMGVKQVQLNEILQQILQEIVSLVKRRFCDDQIVIVLDESQVLLTKHAASFKAANPKTGRTRPVLREIVANLLKCTASWPTTFALLGLGTGISAQSIEDALVTIAGKLGKYETHTDIGAFDTRTALEAYVRRYVPESVLISRNGRIFLARCWEWLRGRHRFLAQFLTELIRVDYKAPNTVLNEYVEKLTAGRLSDADEYVKAEEAEVAGIEMSRLSPILNPDHWRPKTLIMTLARIFACYLMRGDVSVVCGQDEHNMINLGIARYRRTNLGVKGAAKNSEACIDEPLVMLAGTLHFDVVLKSSETPTSIFQLLAERMADHSAPFNRNGYEEFMILVWWYCVFHEPVRYGDIFDTHDRPDLADEKLVMALTKLDANGDLVVHSSARAGPRPDVIEGENGDTTVQATQQLHYYTASSTLGTVCLAPGTKGWTPERSPEAWIQHKTGTAFCFLPTCYGPDVWTRLQFVGGKYDGMLVTASIQDKFRRYRPSDEEARGAIMSVTPAHLGDAKLKRAQTSATWNNTEAELNSLRKHMANAYKPFERGNSAHKIFGPCRVLRVIASSTDLDLGRLDKETSTLKFQKELDDPHPFALLNTRFVDSILTEYSPVYVTTIGGEEEMSSRHAEDRSEDAEIPAVSSTSGATDDRAQTAGGANASTEGEDTEEQKDDLTAVPSISGAGTDPTPETGNEDARMTDEDMEDVSAIPSTSGAGDSQVTMTMTTRGGAKRSHQGTGSERASKRSRAAAAAQASPSESQRIVTRSVSRMQQAAASIGTRRSTRLATKVNATAGTSTRQASGTGPAK